jgi:hypothetical protein
MPNLTDAEEAAVISAFQSTSDALSRVRIALQQQFDASVDPQEKNELALDLNEVDQDIADNDAKYDNFLDGKLALQPPTDAELQEIAQNAAEVAKFTSQNQTAEALLTLATHSVTLLKDATGA